jgi:hypothetical protein
MGGISERLSTRVSLSRGFIRSLVPGLSKVCCVPAPLIHLLSFLISLPASADGHHKVTVYMPFFLFPSPVDLSSQVSRWSHVLLISVPRSQGLPCLVYLNCQRLHQGPHPNLPSRHLAPNASLNPPSEEVTLTAIRERGDDRPICFLLVGGVGCGSQGNPSEEGLSRGP